MNLDDRLPDQPALREVIRAKVDDAFFDRLGVSPPPPPAGGGALEAIEDPQHVDHQEAIIQLVGRPPLVVRNRRVEIEPDSLVDFPTGTDALIAGTEKWIPSVGRVEFVNSDMAWGGSGWVFKKEGNDRIVVTNRHVAKLVAQRTSTGKGVFLRDASMIRYGMNVDFDEEVGSLHGDAFTFEVVDIPYLADVTEPDVALLRITGPKLPAPLVVASAEAKKGELVAVIGYPARDSRNDADAMASYFQGLYDVKRYAPGVIQQAIGSRSALDHDCTTLGGNSGSPVIRLKDGKVIGLHYSGIYGKQNRAVGVKTLNALLDGRRPVAIRIAEEEGVETTNDGVHHGTDLADRPGYDPTFLGTGALVAPWPKIAASDAAGIDLAEPTDQLPGRKYEIRYTHFGIRFSQAWRQPAMTAVNIDGRHKVPIKRGKSDQWFQDARIPIEVQLTKADYAHEEIDRGHLVRREDPNWDPAVPVGNPDDVVTELATRANVDTFHYTNAAVQAGNFNSGSTQWLGLEDHILKSSKTHGFRTSVFTGPVLRDDDPEIAPGVFAPQEFWKLVVMEKAARGSLHATAYLLSQGQFIHQLLEDREAVEAVEGFEFGAYRTFQIAVADLAAATGYDFDAYVDADPLAATAGGQEAITTGEPLAIPIESLDQLVL